MAHDGRCSLARADDLLLDFGEGVVECGHHLGVFADGDHVLTWRHERHFRDLPVLIDDQDDVCAGCAIGQPSDAVESGGGVKPCTSL